MITLSLPSLTIPHMTAFACVCLLMFIGRGGIKVAIKAALNNGRRRSKAALSIALGVTLLFSILCMFNPVPGGEAEEAIIVLKVVLGIMTVIVYSFLFWIPKLPPSH